MQSISNHIPSFPLPFPLSFFTLFPSNFFHVFPFSLPEDCWLSIYFLLFSPQCHPQKKGTGYGWWRLRFHRRWWRGKRRRRKGRRRYVQWRMWWTTRLIANVSLAVAQCLACPSCPAIRAWSPICRNSRGNNKSWRRKSCQGPTQTFNPHTLCPVRRGVPTRPTRVVGTATTAACSPTPWPSMTAQRIWALAHAASPQPIPARPVDPPATPGRWISPTGYQRGWPMWLGYRQPGGPAMDPSTPGLI